MPDPDSVPEVAGSDSGLARHAGLTGAATLVSRVLGLVRDQVLAALFGAGNEMDAFLVAFRIPNLVRDLFAEGAMSAAFVPTFTAHLTHRGRADAWRLANNVLTALIVVTAAVAAIGMVFAAPLAALYARDYANVPGKLELTIRLTRVVFPFLMFVAVAAAAMGMLNSLHHYFVPALSPAMFNIATIVCALALVPVMPALGLPRIMAVAIGALAGGVGQAAIQWPSLRREGFRYRPVFDPRDPGLRRVLMLMGPGTIGLAATQVNLFVNTLLATSQGTGAVSWLSYAFRLMYLPIGLFGVSIGTAVLPAVSRHAARDDVAGIRGTVSRGLAMMLIVNVPATLGLVVLAVPIVELLFEHGQFSAADTQATAWALRMYAIGLVGYSAVRIASPTFYAIGRPRVPVLVSAGSIAVNIAASLTLVRVMGFGGLALGTSIAAIVNAALLAWLLRGHIGGIDGRRLAVTAFKVAVAACAMASASVAVQYGLERAIPGSHLIARAARLSGAIGAGLVVLVAVARWLRIEELGDAVTMVQARVRKVAEPLREERAAQWPRPDIVRFEARMARSSSPYASSVSFSPGPVSTALKILISANVAVFVLQRSPVPLLEYLALRPDHVLHEFWIWQLATYMFLHGGIFHILFNMLALWMFGAQLEQIWGTRYFLKFYFVTGIGAGALTVAFSLLPFDFAQQLQSPQVFVIGASGAIYALLLAYAMYFPERPILLLLFWVPAKWCVAILGAIALYSSLGDVGGVANATHLGGLLVGYLYLKRGNIHPILEARYRINKWRLNRMRGRKKFDVYSGGRSDDINRRVH